MSNLLERLKVEVVELLEKEAVDFPSTVLDIKTDLESNYFTGDLKLSTFEFLRGIGVFQMQMSYKEASNIYSYINHIKQ